MSGPAIGSIYDGYRFMGGDPSNQASWTPVTGPDAVVGSAQYNKTSSNLRAKSDQAKLDGASATEQAAYDNEQTANRAREVINADTPTGLMADQRIAAGKVLKNTWLSGKLGVPSAEQTANLETLKTLGNQGALGQVGQLKGPLSDRDVAFLKSLQYDPGNSHEQNQRVVDAHQWVAKRQAGYSAALRTWADTLGSPSATNARGETFERWWGGWSADHLPAPGIHDAHPTAKPASAAAKAAPTGRPPPEGIDATTWAHMPAKDRALWP